MAVLHPPGEPRGHGGAAAREALAHLQPLGHPGDGAGQGGGGHRAPPRQGGPRLPVQLPRVPAEPLRAHVVSIGL